MKYTAENLSRNNQIVAKNCLRHDHPLYTHLNSCTPDLHAKFILHPYTITSVFNNSCKRSLVYSQFCTGFYIIEQEEPRWEYNPVENTEKDDTIMQTLTDTIYKGRNERFIAYISGPGLL